MVLKLARPNVTVLAICSGDHVASNLSSMIATRSSVHFPFGTELLWRIGRRHFLIVEVGSIRTARIQRAESSASSNPVLDVTKEQHVETSLTESSGPSSEPKNPTVSDSSALTNSSKKPTYSKEQTHPNQTVSQPKAGDKKSGMIYVDGFGWVKDEGGGAVGETVGNDGDLYRLVRELGIPADTIFYPEVENKSDRLAQFAQRLALCDEMDMNIMDATLTAILENKKKLSGKKLK